MRSNLSRGHRDGNASTSSYLGSMLGWVTAEKYSASMDAALLSEARAAAQAEGLSLSGWLADAAADRLRLRALHELVVEWEAQHGTITAEDLAAIDRKVSDARRQAEQRTGRPRNRAAS